MKNPGRIALYALLACLIAAPFVAAGMTLFAHRAGEAAPPFSLTDQDGKPFSLIGQRGKAVVLFFGYTHCPDVCPTTLAAIARAYRSLGSPASLQVVFVTVDPKRDTPTAMRTYVSTFDPHFLGLTGDEPALDQVYKEYGIYRAIDPGGSTALGYTVSHSAVVFLIDRDGSIVKRFDWQATPREFAQAFRKVTS